MNNNHLQVWNNCLAVIKDNISPISFKTWFDPIVPLNLENQILTLQVPSHFFYEYLEERYIDILRQTLRKEIGNNAKLEYNVVVDSKPVSNTKPISVVVPGSSSSHQGNWSVNSTGNQKKQAYGNPFAVSNVKTQHVDSQLNTVYSFDNFVEGDCNKLARSAGIAVAENPGGTAFNPLVLHGDSGLGKTHLAQAIGLKTKELHQNKKVLYLSADKFQTQFTEAVCNNNKNDFLHFYQMIDVLIIDDIQELAGKEKTQTIFFHIFNHLHQTGKQLILTSDKAPIDLKGMEERLLSRFKWGLSTDLQKPDYDTRLRILQQKSYKNGIELGADVMEYIAEHVTNNVRELEGVLAALLARSALMKKDLNVELAKTVVGKLVRNTKPELSIHHIQKKVCEYFSLPVNALQSKTRKREIVQARQIAMYFSKKLTQSSSASIGAQIGNKDHATVLHACKTVRNLRDTDKKFKDKIDEINKQLHA